MIGVISHILSNWVYVIPNLEHKTLNRFFAKSLNDSKSSICLEEYKSSIKLILFVVPCAK